MAHLKRQLLYAVTDALGIVLEYEKATDKIRGTGAKNLLLGGMKVAFNVQVVSSCAFGERTLLLMARVKGNLALLVHAGLVNGQDEIAIHFLNLAHMGPVPEWLEKQNPGSAEDCLKLLGKAVARSFRKNGKEWLPL